MKDVNTIHCKQNRYEKWGTEFQWKCEFNPSPDRTFPDEKNLEELLLT